MRAIEPSSLFLSITCLSVGWRLNEFDCFAEDERGPAASTSCYCNVLFIAAVNLSLVFCSLRELV
mgnify:CR=1 FL=1